MLLQIDFLNNYFVYWIVEGIPQELHYMLKEGITKLNDYKSSLQLINSVLSTEIVFLEHCFQQNIPLFTT